MQLEQVGTYAELAFTERLDLLLDHERQCRQQRNQRLPAPLRALVTSQILTSLPNWGKTNLNKPALAENPRTLHRSLIPIGRAL